MLFKTNYKSALILFLFILPVATLQGQEIQQLLADPLPAAWKVKSPQQLRQFYAARNDEPAWTGNGNLNNRESLLFLLAHAADYGIDSNRFRPAWIRNAMDSASTAFSESRTDMDIRMTDIAIDFFQSITFGVRPMLAYNGLQYQPSCEPIPQLLAARTQVGRVKELAADLQPPLPEVAALLQQLQLLQKRWSNSDVRITSTKLTLANTALVKKLYRLGIADSVITNTDSLVQGVKAAQRLFGLLDDGALRPTTLAALNVSLEMRMAQLQLSIGYYRWLYCLARQEPVVVVNLPAAWLKVYGEGDSLPAMRLVVGKPKTPTPTLSSRITEVVLYPYWNVPYSIATKELLPAIRRNPGYINAGNYQVLNSNGNIVNPYSVDWNALSAGNFPYTIRQSTGCDNALGVIKLNFYNPFSVYLHDTPSKSLFQLNKRFFSHGCMRLGEPEKLARFLLADNAIAVDTLVGVCLLDKKPTPVPVKKPVAVVVWYNPAGLNEQGKLVMYDDIYKKFPSELEALRK